jgi:hypothetical protein
MNFRISTGTAERLVRANVKGWCLHAGAFPGTDPENDAEVFTPI